MKKILAILTALAVLLTFAACGSKTNEPKSDNAEKTTEQSASEQTSKSEDPKPEDFPGGLAEDGAQVLKFEGVDYNISLIEPATYWNQDVSTMEYTTDADEDCGLTVWAKDSTNDDTTVCIQQLRDQTYKGTSAERTKSDEFKDYTFETAQVGSYTLYHAKARENADGYKEEHMFVDFNGCTLSFFGCYYNFETFCSFLEATLAKMQVEKTS